jgi:hypothetical protein
MQLMRENILHRYGILVTQSYIYIYSYNLETGPVVPKVFSADPTGSATSGIFVCWLL